MSLSLNLLYRDWIEHVTNSVWIISGIFAFFHRRSLDSFYWSSSSLPFLLHNSITITGCGCSFCGNKFHWESHSSQLIVRYHLLKYWHCGIRQKAVTWAKVDHVLWRDTGASMSKSNNRSYSHCIMSLKYQSNQTFWAVSVPKDAESEIHNEIPHVSLKWTITIQDNGLSFGRHIFIFTLMTWNEKKYIGLSYQILK